MVPCRSSFEGCKAISPRGKVISKEAPRPMSLSTSIVPACRSTRLFAIDSPVPNPHQRSTRRVYPEKSFKDVLLIMWGNSNTIIPNGKSATHLRRFTLTTRLFCLIKQLKGKKIYWLYIIDRVAAECFSSFLATKVCGLSRRQLEEIQMTCRYSPFPYAILKRL